MGEAVSFPAHPQLLVFYSSLVLVLFTLLPSRWNWVCVEEGGAQVGILFCVGWSHWAVQRCWAVLLLGMDLRGCITSLRPCSFVSRNGCLGTPSAGCVHGQEATLPSFQENWTWDPGLINPGWKSTKPLNSESREKWGRGLTFRK